jgi:dTMP kinase
MKKGKIIVIEGASDGIGKTTQLEELKKHLKNDKVPIVTHHFPTYRTFQGAPATKYLAGVFGPPENNSPYFINSIYAIDRACSWRLKLKKQYDLGKVLLLDRYTTSSLIYQVAHFDDIEEKKAFIDYIIDFEYNKLEIGKPDKVLFLYTPYNIVKKLREERTANDGITNDVYEKNDDFLKKSYENAVFVANYLGWDIIDCTKNNKMAPVSEIHEKIYEKVSELLSEECQKK